MNELPVLDQQPAVRKVIDGYNVAKRKLAEMEGQTATIEAEAARLKVSAERAPVDVATGDLSEEGAAQIRADAEAAQKAVTDHAEALRVQRQAIKILRERIGTAREETSRAIRPAWEGAHRELFDVFTEKILEAKALLDELAEIEKRAWDEGGVELPKVRKSEILKHRDGYGTPVSLPKWIESIRAGYRHATTEA